MNQLIIEGRLTKPVDFKESRNGEPYAVLNLAQSKKDKQGEWESLYVRATCFKWTAKKAEGLQKGDRVLVSGPIKINTYDDKMGTKRYSLDMVAQEVLPVSKAEYKASESTPDLEIPQYDTSADTTDIPF